MVARAVAHVPGATRKFFKDRHTKSIDHAPPRVDEALVRTEVLLPGGLVGVRPLAADGLPGLLPARGIAVSEWPQTRKRNHPLPSFLETSRIDGVKATLHDRTPGSHRIFRRISSSCFSGATSFPSNSAIIWACFLSFFSTDGHACKCMGFSPGLSRVIIRKSRWTFRRTALLSSFDLSAPDASADLIIDRGGFQTHCSCFTIASLTCVERRLAALSRDA